MCIPARRRRAAEPTAEIIQRLQPRNPRNAAPTVIYEDTFEHGLDSWVWEGPPDTEVELDGGSVLIDPRAAHSRGGVGTEGVNLWCRTPLTGDWDMTWDLQPIAPSPHQGKKCNLLFILGARYEQSDLNVVDLSPQRTGHYPWLTGDAVAKVSKALGRDIPPMRNTTITYYRINEQHDPAYMLVARHNPGFHLLKRLPQTAEDQVTRRHTVTIRKRGDRVSLLQAGQVVMAFEDEQGIADGYFGFRTWRAAVKLFSIKITRPNDRP